MKRTMMPVVGVAAMAVMVMGGSAQQKAADQSFGTGWEDLAPAQQVLLEDWIQRFSGVTGEKLDPRKAFGEAPVSLRTTYDAVTNALLTTTLTAENAESLGTALDLISSMETVHGKVTGARGDVQFRVYALLKPGAMDTLIKSREFKRTRDNTVYQKGYPISFRQQGGT